MASKRSKGKTKPSKKSKVVKVERRGRPRVDDELRVEIPVRLRRSTHERLRALAAKDETYNDVVERLLRRYDEAAKPA